MIHLIYTNERGDVLSLIKREGLYASLTITLKKDAPRVGFSRRYTWGELRRAQSDFETLQEFGGFNTEEVAGERAA